MDKDKEIVVDKSGMILGVGRYTEIPFAALSLSEHNTMFPKEARRQVFKVNESAREADGL